MANSLGELIHRRRLELGLTQEELADRVGDGVRQAEISRLEHDRVSLPRRARLEQIARALDIPLGVLLAGSGWTGAHEAFDTPPEAPLETTQPTQPMQPAIAQAPEPAPAQSFVSTANSVRARNDVPFLRQELDRARDLIDHSGDTVRNARDTMRSATEAMNRRRAMTDRAEAPEEEEASGR